MREPRCALGVATMVSASKWGLVATSAKHPIQKTQVAKASTTRQEKAAFTQDCGMREPRCALGVATMVSASKWGLVATSTKHPIQKTQVAKASTTRQEKAAFTQDCGMQPTGASSLLARPAAVTACSAAGTACSEKMKAASELDHLFSLKSEGFLHGIILDLFCGSGRIGAAAESLGFPSLSLDINEGWDLTDESILSKLESYIARGCV